MAQQTLLNDLGLTLTPQASNPGGTYNLWVNSADGNALYLGASAVGGSAIFDQKQIWNGIYLVDPGAPGNNQWGGYKNSNLVADWHVWADYPGGATIEAGLRFRGSLHGDSYGYTRLYSKFDPSGLEKDAHNLAVQFNGSVNTLYMRPDLTILNTATQFNYASGETWDDFVGNATGFDFNLGADFTGTLANPRTGMVLRGELGNYASGLVLAFTNKEGTTVPYGAFGCNMDGSSILSLSRTGNLVVAGSGQFAGSDGGSVGAGLSVIGGGVIRSAGSGYFGASTLSNAVIGLQNAVLTADKPMFQMVAATSGYLYLDHKSSEAATTIIFRCGKGAENPYAREYLHVNGGTGQVKVLGADTAPPGVGELVLGGGIIRSAGDIYSGGILNAQSAQNLSVSLHDLTSASVNTSRNKCVHYILTPHASNQLNLHASPAEGDTVVIANKSTTTAAVIGAQSSKNIRNLETGAVASTYSLAAGQIRTFVYIAGTEGQWIAG